jgi:uncharacterized Tic20 family protein
MSYQQQIPIPPQERERQREEEEQRRRAEEELAAATGRRYEAPPVPQQSVQQSVYQTPPQLQGVSTQEERTYAMLCHLASLAGGIIPLGGILGPLVVWLMKKDTMSLVNDQGKASLNFQVTVHIALIVSALLAFVGIGFVLFPVIALGSLVLTIIAAVAAQEGKQYRYPFTLRFF